MCSFSTVKLWTDYSRSFEKMRQYSGITGAVLEWLEQDERRLLELYKMTVNDSEIPSTYNRTTSSPGLSRHTPRRNISKQPQYHREIVGLPWIAKTFPIVHIPLDLLRTCRYHSNSHQIEPSPSVFPEPLHTNSRESSASCRRYECATGQLRHTFLY